MVKCVCKNCNYRFEADQIKKCPYCDGLNIMKDLGAEDLVEELS